MLGNLQELVNLSGRIPGTSEDKFIDVGVLMHDLGIIVLILAEHLGVVLIFCWVDSWKPGFDSGL